MEYRPLGVLEKFQRGEMGRGHTTNGFSLRARVQIETARELIPEGTAGAGWGGKSWGLGTRA